MRRSLSLLLLVACDPSPWVSTLGKDTDTPGVDNSRLPDDTERRDETGSTAETGRETNPPLESDTPPPAPTFVGAEVDFAVHCCEAPPVPGNRQSALLTAAVSPSVEYPAIGGGGTAGVVGADVDIGDTTLDIVYDAYQSTATGSFNGYRFDFRGEVFTRVLSVSLGSATTAPRRKVSVSSDDRSIYVDVAGLDTEPGMRISVIAVLE